MPLWWRQLHLSPYVLSGMKAKHIYGKCGAQHGACSACDGAWFAECFPGVLILWLWGALAEQASKATARSFDCRVEDKSNGLGKSLHIGIEKVGNLQVMPSLL